MKIDKATRDAFYQVLYARRDVRSEFLATPIEDDVIQRILNAAHHAPSVGFMQPWDFIVIKNEQTRAKIKAGFEQANAESAEMFDEQRKSQYQKLKLEGILDAPLGICVTCDRSRTGDVVLGKTIKPEMDLYSTVCAVQNMWLAARAENLGLGWVSILHDEVLHDVLAIPNDIQIIGYMCIGYVSEFHDKPELERKAWQSRRDVKQAIHTETWSGKNEQAQSSVKSGE
ncbi:5,6-dimethylbenzimidazole synthase [Catenovulum sp. SM1970]|uniref:5,6-dimethylbenzimidazole synthase n=1 Tax=Marinifaba aquimaris TaxID=2741323 RepID=UPI001574A422|nr:5,6-dimethylbenzimidazole synthase [Marinifaba aquimaris]